MEELRTERKCLESPDNIRQAALWLRQTGQDVSQIDEDGPLSLEGQGNPWIENLPHRRKRRSGVPRFAFAICMISLITWCCAVFIPREETDTDHPSFSENFIQRRETNENVHIPVVSGGETQLSIKKEHGETLSAGEIFRKVNPAVVTVLAEQRNGRSSMGTGILFTADGFFLTNAHVIDGGVRCSILLANGDRYDASLVGYDTERDVAVLKALKAEDLPTVEIGDSDQLQVGDRVYAIGNPLSIELRGTLTDGIISALDRNIEMDGQTMTLIQTNAALNAGNSGGPLINEYGQVVGINAAKMSSIPGTPGVEGLGFAIPSSTVEYLANQILKTGAALPNTSIGIVVRPVKEEDGAESGLFIESVTPDSGADYAGLQKGDIIVAAEGEAVETSEDLIRVRRTLAPGDELQLTILRNGHRRKVTVILDEA